MKHNKNLVWLCIIGLSVSLCATNKKETEKQKKSWFYEHRGAIVLVTGAAIALYYFYGSAGQGSSTSNDTELREFFKQGRTDKSFSVQSVPRSTRDAGCSALRSQGEFNIPCPDFSYSGTDVVSALRSGCPNQQCS